jgi:hypothetical protein
MGVLWINPTWSGTGTAAYVKVTIPSSQMYYDRTGPNGTFHYVVSNGIDTTASLDQKTEFTTWFPILQASDSLPAGNYSFTLHYSGTCQAVGTTGALIGDPSQFTFEDTVNVIYRAS